MNLLIVCSGNKNRVNAFISEQAMALEQRDIRIYYFLVKGNGITGYLKNLPRLLKTIQSNGIKIIHAHYGLSGLLSALQKKIPVVTTFHGSDVNQPKTRWLSQLAARLSAHNIIVEKSFLKKINASNPCTLMPCGVDLDRFYLINRDDARTQLGFGSKDKLVLFTSSFDNPVKNYPLAKAAVEKVPFARLIELKGYSRSEINLLMNAADMLLLTSFSEGSPQVVKEALATNLPVIATPVGDVHDLLEGVSNSYITAYDSNQIAQAITTVFNKGTRSNGREKISLYDNKRIAERLHTIYQTVLNKDHA